MIDVLRKKRSIRTKVADGRGFIRLLRFFRKAVTGSYIGVALIVVDNRDEEVIMKGEVFSQQVKGLALRGSRPATTDGQGEQEF